MNFSGYCNDIVKRSEHYKTPRKRNFTTQSRAFSRYGFLEDLHQDMGLTAQYFRNLTGFYDFGFHGKRRKIKSSFRFIADSHPGKLKNGANIRTQVGIMEERIFFKANVHKRRIQAGNQFFYLAQV